MAAPLTVAAASSRLVVTVTDSLSGDPVPGVSVRAKAAEADGAPQVTVRTDDGGTTRLHLEPGQWALRLRHGSFATTDHAVRLGDRDTTVFIALRPLLYRMPERLAQAVAEPTQPGVTSLAPTEVTRYPSPVPDPVRILRVLPGVASGGDQSATAYSVRGGSWDENLVRIEGVEIDAPQLLRAGLAETLSPVNGDLVEDVSFHVGVLPASFGDRLSSALDVGYRRPDSLEVFALAGATRKAATAELRAVRFDGPDELLWLPKLRLTRSVGEWRLALAAGLAAQPPLYKELLNTDGAEPAAQKGADVNFEAERQAERWRWRGSAYYRRGWDRISFTVDDVELRYAPGTDSRTRTWGAETQVRGQVGRAVGSVSYSFLWAEENLDTDAGGWLPTATDQRHTATAYLEDRMDLRLGWL